MSNTIIFDSIDSVQKVLGSNDVNLPYLENLLECEIFVKGNKLTFESDKSFISTYFSHLMRLSIERDDPFEESELFMEYNSILSSNMLSEVLDEKVNFEKRIITVNGKTVFPKSENQRVYINSIFTNQVVFGIGPAGTGKTFLAVAYALSELLSGNVKKIVLTRPVVEAGESLGFLPGDLSQKLNPYLKPFFDAMECFINPMQIKKMEENGLIEISPLAYMRGRSINNSVIILDEAQNTTRSQMKMFLTRLGENSRAIITGDITQIDLPRRQSSGLLQALDLLRDIPSISRINFNASDCIRSRLVRAIIDAYEGDVSET